MSPFVEALKRAYKNGVLTIEKIDNLLREGKISQEEYQYILQQTTISREV